MKAMVHRVRSFAPAVVALALLAAACTSNSTAQGGKTPTPTATATPTATPTATTPFSSNIDPSLFDENSADITNPWVPLKPGTQWIWEGTALDGEDEIERRVVFTVTDMTKKIAGVNALVGWDRDFNNGVLSEEEIIFLAQDKQGNIWHFGQYVELYAEGGELDGGRAWVAGYVEGAKAGFHMKANSKVGDAPYSQGFAPPPFFWDDFSRVLQTGQKTCIEKGCYNDVLVIEEYEPTKPGASQTKYYARGVGNIRVGWRGNDAEREEMELISKHTISAAQMEEARTRVLKMEARALAYGYMPPVERRPIPPASPSPTGSPTS